jgi:hypothetical protein
MLKNIKYLYILALVLCIGFISCQSNVANVDEKTETDSTAIVDEVTTEELEELRLLEIADSNYEHDVWTKTHVDQLKERWTNVPTTTQAEFTGAEFGDYFHISFSLKDGNSLDFGDARNNFGEYALINENNEGNTDYIGKQFNVTWEWKPSSFNCCEGNMDEMIANVPTITSLKLVE